MKHNQNQGSFDISEDFLNTNIPPGFLVALPNLNIDFPLEAQVTAQQGHNTFLDGAKEEIPEEINPSVLSSLEAQLNVQQVHNMLLDEAGGVIHLDRPEEEVNTNVVKEEIHLSDTPSGFLETLSNTNIPPGFLEALLNTNTDFPPGFFETLLNMNIDFPPGFLEALLNMNTVSPPEAQVNAQQGYNTFLDGAEEKIHPLITHIVFPSSYFGVQVDAQQGHNTFLNGAEGETYLPNTNIISPSGFENVQQGHNTFLEPHNTDIAFSFEDRVNAQHETEEEARPQDQLQQSQQNLPNQLSQPVQQSQSDVEKAQSIINFLNFLGAQENITLESIIPLVRKYTGPKLFAKIRGPSAFREDDYNKRDEKGSNWDSNDLKLLLSLLEQHKDVVRELDSNHGCVKRSLWEFISYMFYISPNVHNVSPSQCATKFKNIKKTYTDKGERYQYKPRIDTILGSNWLQKKEIKKRKSEMKKRQQ